MSCESILSHGMKDLWSLFIKDGAQTKQKHPCNCDKIQLLLKLGPQTDVLLLTCARMFFNLLFLVVLELKVSLFIAHL